MKPRVFIDEIGRPGKGVRAHGIQFLEGWVQLVADGDFQVFRGRRHSLLCKFRCIGHCLEIPLDGAGAVLHFYEGIVKFLRSLVEER